ncbi:hypothetical protein ANTPLA_LOCUS6269 [Anthophora plagiata]
MPESARPESVVPVNFSNLVLKRWLHFVGPVRRCEVLKKLKADLQNLGLSRRQVYRGLIQLATKPRVILTRQPSYRRYGSKKLLEENEDAENNIYASCRTIVSLLDQHPQQRHEDAQKSNWTDRFSEDEGKRGENTERVKTCETARMSNIQVSVVSSRDCKLENHPPTTLHSFDKTLEQLDRLVPSKMSTQEKSSSKRTFAVSADSTCKSQHKHWTSNNDIAATKMSNKGGSHVSHTVEKHTQKTQKIPDLVSDKIDSDTVHISSQSKKNRIKLNVNSCCNKKSEIHKTVDTDYVKSDIDKKLCNYEKNIDTKVDSVSNKDKHFKHKNHRSVLAVTEATKAEENACKRRLHETMIPDSSQRRKKIRVFADENKEIDTRKRNKMKKKFRIIFGDNMSLSEDEQEVDLLQKRFKRRRKKDSVDSCDSGVCDAERNTPTNSVEILKDIQKAVPDSTMHEECNEDTVKETTANVDIIDYTKEVTSNESINTDIDQVESVKSAVQVENDKLQNDTFTKDNVQTSKEELPDEKLISASDKSNAVESTVASNDIVVLSTIEQSEEVSVREVEGTIETDSTTLSCDASEICSSTRDVLVEHEGPLQFDEIALDTESFDELLHMSFDETCQIISDGNVLSIQETVNEGLSENVMNKEIDENSNLKVSPVVQAIEDQHVKKEENRIEENNNIHLDDTQLLFEVKKDESISALWNALDNVNEPTIQKTKLNNSTEREDAQSNKVSQGRLRVLSSAELGSRWCPTPINAVTSTIPQHSYPNTLTMLQALVTEAVPVTVSTISAPVSATASIETTASDSNAKKSNKDLKFSESVYTTLLMICKLIKKLRACPSIYKLDYDKHLFTEFEKLRKVVNTEDYVELTDGVVRVLNRKMLGNSPLSFAELFSYTPLLKSLCFRGTRKCANVSTNHSNEHANIMPTVTSSQTTSNQNTHYNSQASQNTSGTSVQSRLKNLLSTCGMQNQTSTNITYKQPQQNVSEDIALRPQNNFFQSTMPTNSTVNNDYNNMQQQNYRIRTQETFTPQKISNANSAKPKQMINMHATQGFSLQHPSLPPMNQLGGRHASMPVTNSSFVNQQYAPQTIYIPQINAFYNASIPNYQVPKGLNPTHANTQNVGMAPINQQYQNVVYRQPVCNIPKGIQLQNVQVPLNYVPQPVQAMFAVHVPQTMPKNTEQNERIHKKIFPQVQSSIKVPQNLPEQMSYQNAQNTYSRKTKQPILLAKKKENVQVSLESTTKLFDILKYLSDIQKLMLLKQVDYYFNCTTWLAGQFTFQQWEKINKQRYLLLKFQTLLRHLVEKTIKGSLLNKSQANTFETNILANINIDVPKSVQIVVQENKDVSYQLDLSKINKEQSKIINSVDHQENLNVTQTQNQSKRGHEATDNLQNKELSDQIQKSKVLDKEVQKSKSLEKQSPLKVQEDNIPINTPSSLETQASDINVHQEDETALELQISTGTCNLNTKEQNLEEPEKTVEEKPLIELDVKPSNKDTLHQSNTCSVIVEVSSNNDQVTVIDTTSVNEIQVSNEKLKEHEQLQEEKFQVTNANTSPSLKDTTCEVSIIPSPKTLEKIEQLSDIDTKSTSPEESTVSHIADVRSISLEAFEKISQCNNVPTGVTEGNIEEEEIKICLFCGKPSIVACSICLEAKYCSRMCFELHWQDHYKDCTLIENSVIYS